MKMSLMRHYKRQNVPLGHQNRPSQECSTPTRSACHKKCCMVFLPGPTKQGAGPSHAAQQGSRAQGASRHQYAFGTAGKSFGPGGSRAPGQHNGHGLSPHPTECASSEHSTGCRAAASQQAYQVPGYVQRLAFWDRLVPRAKVQTIPHLLCWSIKQQHDTGDINPDQCVKNGW